MSLKSELIKKYELIIHDCWENIINLYDKFADKFNLPIRKGSEFGTSYYIPAFQPDEDFEITVENLLKKFKLEIIKKWFIPIYHGDLICRLLTSQEDIEDIIIDRRYRKMGYGSKILQMIIDFAKKKKVDCIEVCTKKDNKIAQGLYLKFGFKDRKNIALRLWLKQG